MTIGAQAVNYLGMKSSISDPRLNCRVEGENLQGVSGVQVNNFFNARNV